MSGLEQGMTRPKTSKSSAVVSVRVGKKTPPPPGPLVALVGTKAGSSRLHLLPMDGGRDDVADPLPMNGGVDSVADMFCLKFQKVGGNAKVISGRFMWRMRTARVSVAIYLPNSRRP